MGERHTFNVSHATRATKVTRKKRLLRSSCDRLPRTVKRHAGDGFRTSARSAGPPCGDIPLAYSNRSRPATAFTAKTPRTPRKSWRLPPRFSLATADLEGDLQPVRQRNRESNPHDAKTKTRRRQGRSRRPCLSFCLSDVHPRPAVLGVLGVLAVNAVGRFHLRERLRTLVAGRP